MWVPTGRGLQTIKGWPAEAPYFGDQQAREDDIYLHVLDFLAQRASFPGLDKPMLGFQDDVFNISASLAKMEILFQESARYPDGITRMATTETEYIFAICRSIFDLLQEIICGIWSQVSFVDGSRPKGKLPDSFNDVAKQVNNDPTGEGLRQKYDLPEPMIEYYRNRVPFFESLRSFRDSVLHRGGSIEIVFQTERGFAVKEKQVPFSDLPVWRDDHKQKNGLCSLRAGLGYVVQETILACEEFSRTIEKIIAFPKPLVPNMHLYFRGYMNRHILENSDVVEKCRWQDELV